MYTLKKQPIQSLMKVKKGDIIVLEEPFPGRTYLLIIGSINHDKNTGKTEFDGIEITSCFPHRTFEYPTACDENESFEAQNAHRPIKLYTTEFSDAKIQDILAKELNYTIDK